MRFLKNFAAALAAFSASVSFCAGAAVSQLGSVPAQETPTVSAGNYYLDQNSYDPLLKPQSAEGKKAFGELKFSIPGIDSSLEFARKYRQAAYRRHDLQSDASLLVYASHVPAVMLKMLLGIYRDENPEQSGTYQEINPLITDPPAPLPTEEEILSRDIPQDEKDRLIVQLRNSQMTINGRTNPYKKEEMVKMFLQIIKEESASGLSPRAGEPHEWSPEILNYCRAHGIIVPSSKLLLALACGVSPRHFKTGTEEALIKWILARDDGSVTIDRLFRASCRLNGGDCYLALLTAENVLSEGWRRPRREELAVTRKLSVINNFYRCPDKYGNWYHFFGALVYGYAKGGVPATGAAMTEAAWTQIVSHGVSNTQKTFSNVMGAQIGAELGSAVKSGSWRNFSADRNYCDPAVYLSLGEDYRDRIKIVQSKSFRISLSAGRIRLESVNGDFNDCKVEVIYGLWPGGKLDSRTLRTLNGVSFPAGQEALLETPPLPASKVRVFVNSCSSGQSEQALDASDVSPNRAHK